MKAEATSTPTPQARTNNTPGFDANIAKENDWRYTNKIQPADDHSQTISHHDVLANTELPTNHDWERKWLVTGTGAPITTKYITRRLHSKGVHAKPEGNIAELRTGTESSQTSVGGLRVKSKNTRSPQMIKSRTRPRE